MSRREDIQQALDAALNAEDIRCYWKRRAVDSESSESYVVYSNQGNHPDSWADDEPQTRASEWEVVYYFPESALDTPESRSATEHISNLIMSAMSDIGFAVSSYDGGDFEAISMETIIFDCVGVE